MIIYRIWNKNDLKSFIGYSRAVQEPYIIDRYYNTRTKPSGKCLITIMLEQQGKENFDIQTLITLPDDTSRSEINLNLKVYIQRYDSYYPQGYNLKRGVDDGFRYTDNQKERHSQTHSNPDVIQRKAQTRKAKGWYKAERVYQN